MPYVFINDGYLSDIGNAIRSKVGGSQTYHPSEMADAISEIGGATPLTPPSTADKNYIYFQAEEPGATVSLRCNLEEDVSLAYSTDGTNWQPWIGERHGNSLLKNKITLASRGDYVYLKGDNDSMRGSNFILGKRVSCGGNAMSLLDMTCESRTIPRGNAFFGLFSKCTSLTTAPLLPATTLAYGCYGNMFIGCASLTTAPVLPATTLAQSCYSNMFNGCASLTTAPELPATALANNCYECMFNGCASLTTAPELPATTLADSCYSNMFRECTSLTTAPELPATTLTNRCYGYMFHGCYMLNSVKVYATAWNTSDSSGWLNEVDYEGTLYKRTDTSIGNVPSGWSVVGF